MRIVIAALLALLFTALPARAEITWVDAGQTYELSAAALFKLRAELPPELQDSLKAIRNLHYDDEAEFRAALEPALLTDELRAAWRDRLLALAVSTGASFGIEPRRPALTLYIAGADHALDANAFTSQSWLVHLPPAAPVAGNITAALDGACLAVTHETFVLFRLCEPALGASGDKSVLLETTATHVVGLGQEFQTPGDTVAERAGWVRHGLNVMSGFNGGSNGNTLFPVAYFDLPGHPFALVLDNRYAQEWDLSKQPYALRVGDGDLRLHVLAGETLADLRRQYMAMAGRPPVPPKSMFGLWLSEYGYETWAELDGKIASLKAAGFPLSGVVLDLYWFGGISPNSTTSRMGSLRWDETHFPDPARKIASYAADGIGTMLIEESYISSDLPEHTALAEHRALAHDEAGAPLLTNPSGNWWGKGGMIDWLNPDGAAFWHDFRRQPLADMGAAGHWTDLGEPEMVNPAFRYGPANLTEAQAHNSYNVLWAKSIYDGYARNAPDRRPFVMSRSGGIGIAAYGGAMWSGDTAGEFGSLAAQMPQQQHMMWSGIDYYGSDIGGFHRRSFGASPQADAELNDLYTQWFAYSALFEVPVRPHTENLCNCKETAPDRMGDVASNLANIRLRYALEPYYYSLAWRAWLEGEPVFPSLDYYYDDVAANGLGHVKMIGPSLVGAAVAAAGENEVSLYLPAGDWYAIRSTALAQSYGETFTIPVYVGDRLELPVFAKDGAIVPMADGVLRVFGTGNNAFDWYDDDGVSTDYQHGDYSQTRVSVAGDRLVIEPVKGMSLARVLAWTRAVPVTAVTIDGVSTSFQQEGSTLALVLPVTDRPVTVEVR